MLTVPAKDVHGVVASTTKLSVSGGGGGGSAGGAGTIYLAYNQYDGSGLVQALGGSKGLGGAGNGSGTAGADGADGEDGFIIRFNLIEAVYD